MDPFSVLIGLIAMVITYLTWRTGEAVRQIAKEAREAEIGRQRSEALAAWMLIERGTWDSAIRLGVVCGLIRGRSALETTAAELDLIETVNWLYGGLNTSWISQALNFAGQLTPLDLRELLRLSNCIEQLKVQEKMFSDGVVHSIQAALDSVLELSKEGETLAASLWGRALHRADNRVPLKQLEKEIEKSIALYLDRLTDSDS